MPLPASARIVALTTSAVLLGSVVGGGDVVNVGGADDAAADSEPAAPVWWVTVVPACFAFAAFWLRTVLALANSWLCAVVAFAVV